ncbi:MAG: UbiD family decarboxylase, partial [Thermococcus sp.]
MLREILQTFDDLIVIKEPVSKELEITRYLLKYRDRPVLFEDVDGWRVAGNIWSTRERIARFLNTSRERLMHVVADAMENPAPYKTVESAPFLKNSTEDFSLLELP